MNLKFIQYGLLHALIRDLMFLGIYNFFGIDGIIGKLEMSLSLLIPFVISPIIIIKIFNINYLIPVIISCITLIIPNFIPNLILLTYSKNIKELTIPFSLSIVCYIILYFILSFLFFKL